MKRRILEKKEKRKMKMHEKLTRFLYRPWIYFEERVPKPHKDDEEHSTWIKNF